MSRLPLNYTLMILCAQTSKAAGDETFTTSTKYNFAGSGFNASDCVKTNKNLEDSAFKLQSFGKYQSKVLLPWSANYKTPMSLLLSKELCLTAAWGIHSLSCSFSCATFCLLTVLALVGIFSTEKYPPCPREAYLSLNV